MKKLFICLAVMISCAILSGCSSVPNLAFTEEITVYYKPDSKTTETVVISDPEDIADIIRTLTTQTMRGDNDCEMSLLELVFQGQDKTITIYPTPDSCRTVRVGTNKSYILSEENHLQLFQILESNNVFLNLSEKQSDPNDGSYGRDFVDAYVLEHKTDNEASEVDSIIPRFRESVLVDDNDGCFIVGDDPANNLASGYRTDFFERMVMTFPNPLVRELGDSIYLVYDTDQNSRLFLFYSKSRGGGVILAGYPIFMKDVHLYQDFAYLQVGDSIRDIATIDSVMPLYLDKFNKKSDKKYEFDQQLGINFSSVHLLSDGVLKIEYDRSSDGYRIINMTYNENFVLEGRFGGVSYEIYESDYID